MLFILFACSPDLEKESEIMERPVDTADPQETQSTSPEDVDEDGFTTETDCDDWNPLIYPGAIEEPDDEDNDCDGHIDWDGIFQGLPI